MKSIARALLFASAERYVVLACNFVVLMVAARWLSPTEMGVVAIGATISLLTQSIREFGVTAFLVNRHDLPDHVTRSAFTISLAIATLLALAMTACSGTFAVVYRDASLGPYLVVSAAAMLISTLNVPIAALMQRDMDFRAVAMTNSAGAVLNAMTIVALVVSGAGAMGYAWGGLVQSAAYVVVGFALRPAWRVLKPCYEPLIWREISRFGGISSATFLVNRLQDALPSLLIGRLLQLGAAGQFSRAGMVCDLPMKGLLSGIGPVALSALSQEARDRGNLAHAYCRAVTSVTVIQWPCLLIIAVLAHPAVRLLLGEQWLDVVPLVRIMAVAALFSFPTQLTYPVLVAAGRPAQALLNGCFATAVTAAALALVARHGLIAISAMGIATTVVQSAFAMALVRRHVRFDLGDMAKGMAASALVAAVTAMGPLATVGLAGGFAIGITGAIFGGIAGVALWGMALVFSRHPLVADIERGFSALGIAKRIRGIAGVSELMLLINGLRRS